MSITKNEQIMIAIAVLLLFICCCCCSSSSLYYMNISTPTPTHLSGIEDEEEEDEEEIVIVPPKTHRDILVNYGRVGCDEDGKAINGISQDGNSLVAACDLTGADSNQTRRIKRYDSVSSGSHLNQIVEYKLTPACESDEVLNNFQYFKEGSSGMRLEYSCVQVPTYTSIDPEETEKVIENTEYDINNNKFGGLDTTLGSVECLPTANGDSALNNFMITREDADDKINFKTNCQINYTHNTELDPLESISAEINSGVVTVTYKASRSCTVTFYDPDTHSVEVSETVVSEDVSEIVVSANVTETEITKENLLKVMTATIQNYKYTVLTYEASPLDNTLDDKTGDITFGYVLTLNSDEGSYTITTDIATQNINYTLSKIGNNQGVSNTVDLGSASTSFEVSLASDQSEPPLNDSITIGSTNGGVIVFTDGNSWDVITLKAEDDDDQESDELRLYLFDGLVYDSEIAYQEAKTSWVP